MRAGKLNNKQGEQGTKLLTCRHPAIAIRGYAAAIKANDAAAAGPDAPPLLPKPTNLHWSHAPDSVCNTKESRKGSELDIMLHQYENGLIFYGGIGGIVVAVLLCWRWVTCWSCALLVFSFFWRAQA